MFRYIQRPLLNLAHNKNVQEWVTHSPLSRGLVKRFVAGETIDDALSVALKLQQKGVRTALDLLGENISTPAEAAQSTDAFVEALDKAQEAGLSGIYLSVKLTALGLDIDPELAAENLNRILAAARRRDAFVRVDMEGSQYTETTLCIVETQRKEFANIGTVLQSYLYRTDADLERMTAAGIPIRLVKGAYAEPREVSYPNKSDVDAAYLRQIKRLLLSSAPTAIATHDEALIREVKRFVRQNKIPTDHFEFQMLYGIRTDLLFALAQEGYHVRAYVPFGTQWYPYFTRRLAERPANIVFLLNNLRERRHA